MVYTASDKEQMEDLKRWWSDYGQLLTIAIAIGLAIGAGWQFWNRYVAGREDAASQIYQAMQQAALQKQDGIVGQYALQLQTQYKRTVYASLGSLFAARVAVENQKYNDALTQLHWVALHAKQTGIQTIAQLRLARVQLQVGQAKEALSTLQGIRSGSTFDPLIAQTEGEVYKALGQNTQAQAAFTQAYNAFAAQGQQSFVVELNRGQ